MDDNETGGTPISRAKRQPNPGQQMIPPQMARQQPVMNQPMMPPQMARQPVMQQPMVSYECESEEVDYQQEPFKLNKNKLFGSFKPDTKSLNFKYAIVVTIIFILLNSKIIWTQISRLPFMGSFEPSILALLFNSVLSGVLFYIIIKFVK